MTQAIDQQHNQFEHLEHFPTLEELIEQRWSEIRSHRNQLLKQADIQINLLEDNNQDATAYRNYRQQLRDLPTTSEDPNSLVWPTKPE